MTNADESTFWILHCYQGGTYLVSFVGGGSVWKYKEDKRTKEQNKNNSKDFASLPVKPYLSNCHSLPMVQ